jgi:RimJ/RimL family protein N-acetyltransferase
MSTASTHFIQPGDLPLLKGPDVYLRFLAQTDREPLRRLARDERLWEFTKTLLIDPTYDEQFDKYFNEALAVASPGGQPFTIHATGDDSLLGMTRVYDVDLKVKKATIGFTWYIPAVWGKIHNKQCKLLLLQYLFEKRGLMRVDFKVASQNIRSQRAVMKIGGVHEGTLRRFTMRNDGTPSDTFVFSILAEEWPAKKPTLISISSTSPSEDHVPG